MAPLASASAAGTTTLGSYSSPADLPRLSLAPPPAHDEPPPPAPPPGPPPPPRKRRSVRLARELIHARWDQELRLEELSRESGFPISSLERVFKQAYGVSPHRYHLRIRLERGRALLVETKLPIRQVAARSGFQDPNYFSRLFRNHFGVSPAEYRRLIPAERAATERGATPGAAYVPSAPLGANPQKKPPEVR